MCCPCPIQHHGKPSGSPDPRALWSLTATLPLDHAQPFPVRTTDQEDRPLPTPRPASFRGRTRCCAREQEHSNRALSEPRELRQLPASAARLRDPLTGPSVGDTARWWCVRGPVVSASWIHTCQPHPEPHTLASTCRVAASEKAAARTDMPTLRGRGAGRGNMERPDTHMEPSQCSSETKTAHEAGQECSRELEHRWAMTTASEAIATCTRHRK